MQCETEQQQQKNHIFKIQIETKHDLTRNKALSRLLFIYLCVHNARFVCFLFQRIYFIYFNSIQSIFRELDVRARYATIRSHEIWYDCAQWPSAQIIIQNMFKCSNVLTNTLHKFQSYCLSRYQHVPKMYFWFVRAFLFILVRFVRCLGFVWLLVIKGNSSRMCLVFLWYLWCCLDYYLSYHVYLQ